MVSQLDRMLDSLAGLLGRITAGLADSVKELLVILLWATVGCASIGFPLAPINSYALTILIGIFSVSVTAALYAEKPLPSFASLKKRFIIPIEIIGISFVVSFVLFHTVSYLLIGFTFSVLLPIVYLVCQGIKFERVLKPVCKGLLVSFWIMLLISLLSGPVYTGAQFAAFLRNPNHFGNVLIATTTCSSFLFVDSLEKSKSACYFYGITLTVAITLCFMSISRTAIIASLAQCIVIAVASIVVITRFDHNRVMVRLAKSIGVAVMVAAVASAVTVGAFTVAKTAISDALPGLQIPEWFYEENLEEEVNFFEESAERFGKGLESGDGNTFTSGRLGIWQAFAENISLLGHESESMALTSGSRVYSSINAHNVYLQLSYTAGLIAGVAIAVLMVFALIDAFRLFAGFIKGSRESLSSSLMALYCCAAVGFFLYSLVADGYMMFKYLPASMFWLGLAIVAVRPKAQAPERNAE